MTRKRLVVTGGAGFIGSTLVRTLLPHGSVAVIDNLLTGHERNLEEVRGSVEFHNADIRDAAAIAPLIRGADTVFHLAAIPSVPRSIDDPVPSHQVNIDGTFNVFRAAAQGGVRRIVYAASSSAYGDTPTLPKTESMTPHAEIALRGAETDGRILRLGVLFLLRHRDACRCASSTCMDRGRIPSSPYSGVLSLFMKHLLNRTAPTIFGDGEQTRDFTYVEDVAELCYKASQAKGVAGQHVQRRQRRAVFAELHLGPVAEN